MKFNNIYSVLFGAAVMAGFASCTDEVDYTPAEQTPGVYFPVANVSTVKLAEDGSSFDITVGRAGSLAAETVALTNNFEEGTFSMPASVAFAEGEEFADVVISYDGATLAPGQYKLEIGFAEGVSVSQFGYDHLEITATMPEPVVVLDWNDLGECTYTDPFITGGMFTDLPNAISYKVHLEESGDTPGLYRLVAPYGTAFYSEFSAVYPGFELYDNEYDKDNSGYLYINATNPSAVYIQPQTLGATIDATNFGEILAMSDGAYDIYYGGMTPEEAYESNPAGFGVLKNGVLTMPAKSLLVNFSVYNPTSIYYANSSKDIKMIVFPGVQAGDYSAEVEFMGQFNNVSTGVVSAVATAEFGEDVAAVKAGIVNASSATSLVAAIKSGDYEAVDVDVKDPVVSLPVYTSGTYTIAYVTYDSKGEAQDAGSASFEIEVFANDDVAWTDLGSATVADGWLIGGLYIDEGEDPADYAYTVQAQESVNVPGLYRFKNVWGSSNPLGSMTTTPENTCLYVDASDPECITIVPQSTGWTYGNFGTIYAFNWEGYYIDNGYSKATIPANRFTTTLEDGLITVESPLMCGTGPAFSSGWGAYGAGDYAAILLPEVGDDAPAAMAARFNKAAGKISSLKQNRRFTSAFKLARYTNGRGAISLSADQRPGSIVK